MLDEQNIRSRKRPAVETAEQDQFNAYLIKTLAELAAGQKQIMQTIKNLR